VRTRERSPWRERVFRGNASLRVRRGGRRRGCRVAGIAGAGLVDARDSMTRGDIRQVTSQVITIYNTCPEYKVHF